jgi:Fe-S cluster assembly ATP-binding protein
MGQTTPHGDRQEVSTTGIGETRIDAVSTAPATDSSPLFSVKDLHVSVTTEDAGKDASNGAITILRGVNLTINAGEIHAIMGPNGSGKSTLANALLASEEYTVDSGSVNFKGADISDWETDARAKAGMFLAFQYPEEIPGVTVINFMRQALSARKGIDLSTLELRLSIMEWMGRLGMDPDFANRYLNEGFSGGEKKRNEVLQMAILEPDFAILDETDSGLDIDALQIVAKGVHEVRKSRPQLGVLMITHYQRLLELIEPDHVHIMIDGRIVESGGMELVHRLEADGYDAWKAA